MIFCDMTVLEKDAEIRFPQVILLKASAGSGKTHALTERFVQFLLSDKIPRNHLRNILAITFSNNAAKEMKERILRWLKDVHFRDPQRLAELTQVLASSPEELAERAERIIDEVLLNYTEFQVKTIDSFMASIYKASAIDFGYLPDFEILLAPERVMSYAFNRFLRKVRAGAPEAGFLEKLVDIILEGQAADGPYPWDPTRLLLLEVEELYRKVSGIVKGVERADRGEDLDRVKREIREEAERLDDLIEASGLPKSKGSSFYEMLRIIKSGRYPDLIEKGLKNVPVLKPRKEEGKMGYGRICEEWERLVTLIRTYAEVHAKTYYWPYLKTYEAFEESLERVKREEGVIFIDDINKKLSGYLDREIVPDVYFRIGETIYHHLIDEFQDTSPIQWSNLFPLIENSLSQEGSLFAVGDTKQAIYGFRNADYRIMRSLEKENLFRSAHHNVRELKTNYRSLEEVVGFNRDFFHKVVAVDERCGAGAARSGLADYEQEAKDAKGRGYAEVSLFEKNDDEAVEKGKVQNLVKELRERGYRYSDIAILTYRNEDALNVTAWLNELNIPFISYSNLDVRKRKLTSEIVALLTFLDSPRDDLAFAAFLLGDIFQKALKRDAKSVEAGNLHQFFFRNRKRTPLYKLFQAEFSDLWETYFDGLFRSTGYLPLYDLVSEIYRTFRVFDGFGDEEATLIKILEVLKNFEKEGANNPKDFIETASEGETGEKDWTINVPPGIDAVRVMTIHKAKGLGFPVAIVLLYEEMSRGFKYILREGPDGVRLLKVNRRMAEVSPSLEEIYREERTREMVNRLNTLYVGFTRAASELYVVGVYNRGNQFPIDLLKRVSRQAGRKGDVFGGTSGAFQEELKLYHRLESAKFSSPGMEELNMGEKRRGEFIHRVLSLIDYVNEETGRELAGIIEKINREWNCDYPAAEMKKTLLEFLGQEDVRPIFEERARREIKKEWEISDSEGNLFRMDRLIVDEDAVTVIDFKTGMEKGREERDQMQVKNYLRILGEIYPDKKVEGMIANVDLKGTRRVV